LICVRRAGGDVYLCYRHAAARGIV
jgi:hypothetical protein